MQAGNYVRKYASGGSAKGFSPYYDIRATEKWVEYQLDIYDMNKLLMTSDFNTKMDLLAALTIAERKRDYMYRHRNFDVHRATFLFNLVKNKAKVVVTTPAKKKKRK